MALASKIQLSKLAVYWAVFSFVFVLFWSTLLHSLNLTGVGPALSLVFPAILGLVVSLAIYFVRQHQTIEYDDIGYSVTMGKRASERHSWSEFRECSVVRDRYDKRRVRLYASRDQDFIEVDSLSSGLDPYRFRDFASERIQKTGHNETTNSGGPVFDSLERDIHRRANFVADFNETFRNYRMSGERFQLFARGSTRPRGFIFSKLFAVTVMPDYQVRLYASEFETEKEKSQVMRLVGLVQAGRDPERVSWTWLLLFGESPSEDLIRYIEHFGNKDVGIGCIDLSSGALIHSPNQLGKSLRRQMGLNEFVRNVSKKRRLSTNVI